MKVWLNGRLLEERDACISPADRGFLLGDGVFETFRSYSGRLFGLVEHLERLKAGALVLDLSLPRGQELEEAAATLIEANRLPDARLRITVTSGPGPPGPEREQRLGTVLVTASPLVPWPPTATAVVSASTHDETSPLAGVKTTSRAAGILALREARAKGAEEAIFLNRVGNLCEATTANVFCVRDGRVQTPPVSAGCLAGITREHVLHLCAELKIETVEEDLSAAELGRAEEIFLTSSTREVQPIVTLDGNRVGTGAAGPTATRLAGAFSELVRSAS